MRRVVVVAVLVGLGLMVAGGVNATGVWGQATPAVFAAGVQSTNPDAVFYSVSCGSAGNCTAAGQFFNAVGRFEAFVMSSTGGVWGEATPAVFAAGVQNTNPVAYLRSVSCASAGNCTAAGRFRNAAGDNEAFVMSSIDDTSVSTTVPAPALPATGSDTSAGWLVIAFASLVVGAVLVSRRRII